MNTLEISIRSIQHYLYCPRRWGLLEIDRAWAENAFVTKANLLHSRVHDSKKSYSARGKQVFTSVPVFNDLPEYNLYGITDCMELTEDAKGVSVNDSSEKYKICIVNLQSQRIRNTMKMILCRYLRKRSVLIMCLAVTAMLLFIMQM